jgi:2-polyprenyl-3-methyl-5-hydroxy-6-metoxy-1,4-benzoquinol methylase
MARLGFALWSLYSRFTSEHNRCPYCGSIFHARLQRKKFIIEARKCQYCDLIFCWPTDSAEKAKHFYECDYRSGIVTELPSMQELSEFCASGFHNSRYAKPAYIELVRAAIPPPARILDFGASWGYVGNQLQKSGYEVEGFELSQARAEFGRKHLDIPLHSSWEHLHKPAFPRFDLIFTAHTLEHVYDLWSILERFADALVPDGLLLIIVPNGGGRMARHLGVRWGPYIGETHTIAFTADWFRKNLPRHGFEAIEVFSPAAVGKDSMCDGEELICIAQYREVMRSAKVCALPQ